jgi:NAD(P)-dependent dehydrogenase (short-subunit alcohol dehydrogenase family)
MNRFLRGKTAIVTGGSRRLGRAIASGLAELGANILIHDHQSRRGECEDLCRELEKQGVSSWPMAADFERPEEYSQLIERALKTAGRLDILINNASVFAGDTIGDSTFDSLVRHMQINAWAPFVLSREFARHAGKGGKIVNLLDTRVSGYDWKHVTYILSKYLLKFLTKMTALDFAPSITVNAVAPGLILPPSGKDESYLDELAREVPLRRHGSAQDVVNAVLFLLESEFITGQVIYVDGGRHIMENS